MDGWRKGGRGSHRLARLECPGKKSPIRVRVRILGQYEGS
jgi:hypothetical protein